MTDTKKPKSAATDSGSKYNIVPFYNTNIEAEFYSFLSSGGLTPPYLIPADGKIHRFHVEGDKPGTVNGGAILFGDEIPAGAGWSHKTSQKITWCAKQNLSRSESVAMRERTQRAIARNEEESKRQNARAAAKAGSWFNSSKPANPKHPYLQLKQVKPHNLRQSGELLLVPLYFDRKIINLQTINPAGEKRFLRGGAVKGAYSVIGSHKSADRIMICEGWATAATLAQTFSTCVIAAMNCSNLIPVSSYIREREPTAQIIIAADNDRFTEGNPGLNAAQLAARSANAKVAFPEFPEGVPGTDFNDLMQYELTGGVQ